MFFDFDAVSSRAPEQAVLFRWTPEPSCVLADISHARQTAQELQPSGSTEPPSEISPPDTPSCGSSEGRTSCGPFSGISANPAASAACVSTSAAPSAAAAGTASALTWQWLPPDLRNTMYRSNANRRSPCTVNASGLASVCGSVTKPGSGCRHTRGTPLRARQSKQASAVRGAKANEVGICLES